MDRGNIYEIVWDNGCFNCNDKCGTNEVAALNNTNNKIKEENCLSNDINNSTLNEPKFYITWFGTDKNKRQLKTANLAMSKFKHYSISSLKESFKNIFS